MLKNLTPKQWIDYELIDSGHFEKLERFGKYILRRPEPQAIWPKKLTEEIWKSKADAHYERQIKQFQSFESQQKGIWHTKAHMPESWQIHYLLGKRQIHFRLALTSFGHIGIFPEQAENWEYIYQYGMTNPNSKMLNIFAYTGGATLAGAAAQITVTHVDAVKQTVTWANQNLAANENLQNVRWIVDDALKFLNREVRRGNQYHCIVLDPPAYGRGPNGEKWILEENLDECIQLCSKLLIPKGMMIMNLYSMGLSALVIDTLLRSYFQINEAEYGELYLNATSQQKLPLGTYYRFISAQ